MEVYVRYLVFFVSIISFRTVSSNQTLRKFLEDFKDIDSDFDLNEAMERYKPDDYANVTEDIVSKLTDVGPKPTLVMLPVWLKKNHQRKPKKIKRFIKSGGIRNISSAELTKLLNAGMELIDTGERKMEQMRRSISIKERKQLKTNNSTMITKLRGGKIRVKRQGRFAEAAKVDNLKSLRIYLTMFKNLWSRSPTGGSHPLHKDVPKPITYLFKNRIMRFFFPPVGSEKKG